MPGRVEADITVIPPVEIAERARQLSREIAEGAKTFEIVLDEADSNKSGYVTIGARRVSRPLGRLQARTLRALNSLREGLVPGCESKATVRLSEVERR